MLRYKCAQEFLGFTKSPSIISKIVGLVFIIESKNYIYILLLYIVMNRIEYIGSKYKLLEWLMPELVSDTGRSLSVADLFGGTGIVSYSLLQKYPNITRMISNDSEPYSFVIMNAMLKSTYSLTCKEFIDKVNTFDIDDTEEYPMPISKFYSPFGSDGRMFFTIENAKRIDYVRNEINKYKDKLTNEEYMFLLASLLVSADKVSNTASVYGAYLKQFKKRATDEFILKPIHMNTQEIKSEVRVFNNDVMSDEIYDAMKDIDVVYLDPPYNARQYSKNYFPLNIIVSGDVKREQLRGKTGIPDDCFVSDFCKKREAYKSFKNLFEKLFRKGVKKVVMSYNSESIVSKDSIMEAMRLSGYKYVSCKIREYSRFKSSRLEGQMKTVDEYLFIAKL
jgi:adenine-specific DNA-methyltransferase